MRGTVRMYFSRTLDARGTDRKALLKETREVLDCVKRFKDDEIGFEHYFTGATQMYVSFPLNFSPLNRFVTGDDRLDGNLRSYHLSAEIFWAPAPGAERRTGCYVLWCDWEKDAPGITAHDIRTAACGTLEWENADGGRYRLTVKTGRFEDLSEFLLRLREGRFGASFTLTSDWSGPQQEPNRSIT